MCATCGAQSPCRTSGRTREDYPDCHRPLLGTSLGRVAELLAWWNRFHGCGADPRLGELQRAVLKRLAADRTRFSEVVEPSCSLDETGWHFLRFSYAVPGFRADPVGDAGDLLALCRPFGEALSEQVRALLGPARHQAVSLPLMGIAYDAADAWRVKLYLQFADDAGDEPLGIAARLSGRSDLASLFRGRHLHLIGIDLGARGIAGAKLYFRLPQVRLADVARVAGPVALLDDLAGSGVEALRNLLVIHRMRRRDDPALERAAEVDFALPENDLCWEDLAASPIVQRARAGDSPLAALEGAFTLGVRRVSVAVGRADKLNVYFVLNEIDPA